MKRKLFSILTLLLCLCSGAWAGDVYKLQLNGNNKEIINGVTTTGSMTFFTYNSSKHNFNSKFNGCTYDGVSYTNGLKMEGATQVGWTSTSTATVTIVVSTWSANTIKFDGSELDNKDAEEITGGRVFTIEDVEAGSHTVTRGSGENGIFAVTVEYEGSSLTSLSAPNISIDHKTGVVTIPDVTNATKITYTTNGSDPTASSTTYNSESKPVVEDGTTVKAIAVGDGVSYGNSPISSATASLTVATPVLTAHNGTVGITCATPDVTIKYSTDNETWNTYSIPLTYFTNTKVYAKAESDAYANNSATANLDVTAAPTKTAGSQTKILGFVTPGDNNWEYMSGDNGNSGTTNYGIQGKSDTAEEGWSLWISPDGSSHYDKAISGDGSVNSTYTISGNSYQYIKNSNGRQFNIGMPSNLRANRLTIYSWNNGDGTTIWSPVGGNTFTTETEVPIVAKSGATPEIRVFALDDVANNIALNNAGVQQCFIVAVDYTVYVPGPADAEVGGATITYSSGSLSSNTWSGSGDCAGYSFAKGTNGTLGNKSGTSYFQAQAGGDYTISVPSGITITSFTIDGYSNSGDPSSVTYNESAKSFPKAGTTQTWSVASPSAGGSISFTVASKDLIIKSITLETGKTYLTTTDNMAGWRAFYDASQGYTVDSNTKVYVATSKTDDTVTLTPISGIPSGTPVILKTSSSADSHKMTLTKATVAAYEGDNLLTYTTSAVLNKYRLGYKSGEGNGVGFYPYSGTPTSGAVILNVSSVEARALTIVFDDEETTGISATLNDKGQMTNDKVVYDLQGRKVAQPTRGLYIVNGRKVVVK